MKKFIDTISEHWVVSLCVIVTTVGGAIEVFYKFTLLTPFIESIVVDSFSFYNDKIAIQRIYLTIPWVLAISFFIIFLKELWKNGKDHIRIPIYFLGKKLVVRFSHKGSSKEYAAGKVICGYCKIRFESSRSGSEMCPRCGLAYTDSQIKFIIAEARSKWITGRKQKGHIKTGKK